MREVTRGYPWDGERLSRVLVTLRARRAAIGSPSASADAALRPPVLPTGARGVERARRRQETIGFVAAGSFALVVVGGFCLALGIAVGQRVPGDPEY